jgi:hypothetical protein
MTAALIGALGIIVGTLLGGFISLYIARRKKREQALIASRLIRNELESAEITLTGAAQAGKWWESPLPDGVWSKSRWDLIAELGEKKTIDRDARDAVEAAYLLVSSLNGSKAAGGDPNPGEWTENIAYLTRAITSIETWQQDQKQQQDHRRLRYRIFVLAPLVSVATFAVVLAVTALVISRPNIDQTTVSAALQSGLGSDAFVVCAPQGGDFLCTDNQLSAPLSSCLTSQVTPSPSRAYANRVIVIEAALVPSCHDTQDTTTYIAAVTDGKVVAEQTPGEIARQIIRERYPLTVVAPEPESRAIVKAWHSIFG